MSPSQKNYPSSSLFPLMTAAFLGGAVSLMGCAADTAPQCARAAQVVAECALAPEGNPYKAENACDIEQLSTTATDLVAMYDEVGCAGIVTMMDNSDGCLFGCQEHDVSELKPFETDGCSAFPDGTYVDPTRWQDCCIVHDYAYYVGGPEGLRVEADKALRECAANSCSELMGDAMYTGVRAGGTPALPLPWRWGYGWDYDPFNGYRVLPEPQRSAAIKNVEAYKANPVPVPTWLDADAPGTPDDSWVCDYRQ